MSTRLLVVLVVVGYIANVALRIWLSRVVTIPIAHSDEDSYLNTARVFAGGPGGFSSENSLLRRVGYPLLISPAFLGEHEFSTSYRIVHVINALFNAAVFPLAYLLGRLVFQWRQWRAYLVAMVAATMPAAVFYSQIAMTDAVLAPLTVGWALLLFLWLRDPRRIFLAVASTAVAGAYYTIHVRGIIILAVHLGIVLIFTLRRRVGARVLMISLATGVAFVALNQVLILLLRNKLRLSGTVPGGSTADALLSTSGIGTLFTVIGTQLWYLATVSFGLAVVGWLFAAHVAWRGRDEPAVRWTMIGILGATFGVVACCAVILAGTTSATMDLVYARYVHAFAPLWLVIGLAAVFSVSRRTLVWWGATAGGVVLLGGALTELRLSNAAAAGTPLRYGIFGAPELIVVVNAMRSAHPFAFAAIGIVLCALIIALCRKPQTWVPALALAVVANVGMMVSLQAPIMAKVNEVTPTPSLTALGVRKGDKVYATFGYLYFLRLNQAHEVTWADVRTFRGEPPAAAEFVIAPSFPGTPEHWDGSQYGLQRVGGNPDQHWALWRR